MTAPRIVPAAEARVLREAATPGPWRKSDEWNVLVTAGTRYPVISAGLSSMGWPVPHAKRENTALIAAAPDLAATVEALHALLDEAYDIIASQGNPAWDDWCERVCQIDLEVTP